MALDLSTEHFWGNIVKHAGVAKLADALDLGSSVERRVGSSPTFRTTKNLGFVRGFFVSGLDHVDFYSTQQQDRTSSHEAQHGGSYPSDEIRTLGLANGAGKGRRDSCADHV